MNQWAFLIISQLIDDITDLKKACQTGHIGHILRTVWRELIELPIHDVTYDNILFPPTTPLKIV